MKEINKLQERIAFLKVKQANDLSDLKYQYNTTVESLKPMNLLKSASLEIISIPNLKSNVIGGVLGFGLNYVSKKFLNGNSTNPLKRVLGNVLKLAMKNLVGKVQQKF